MKKGYEVEPVGLMIAKMIMISAVVLYISYLLGRDKGIPIVVVLLAVVIFCYKICRKTQSLVCGMQGRCAMISMMASEASPMAGNSITDKAYQETGDCPMPPVHIPCRPNPGPSAGTAMQGPDPRDIPFSQKLGVCSREYLIGRKQHTLGVKLRKDDDFSFLNVRIDICGAIWNAGCTIMREYYKNTGKTMSKGMLYGQLGQMRKHTPSWSLVYFQVLQQIADRILAAYELFFTNAKKKRNGAKLKCSPPKCHKVSKQRSMTFKQYGKGFSFTGPGEVRIQGKKFRYYDSYGGLLEQVAVHTMTVKRNSLGEIFLYITCSADTKGESWEGRADVGMDFGLKRFLTLSDGTVIRHPEFCKQYAKDIRKLSRALSRKQGGKKGEAWSGGYRKALGDLARLHLKIANQRRDWFYKLAWELCKRYYNIPYRRIAVVESLDSDETSYERTLRELGEHPEINCIFIVAAGVEGCLRAVKEKKAKENGVYVMSFDDIDATKNL